MISFSSLARSGTAALLLNVPFSAYSQREPAPVVVAVKNEPLGTLELREQEVRQISATLNSANWERIENLTPEEFELDLSKFRSCADKVRRKLDLINVINKETGLSQASNFITYMKSIQELIKDNQFEQAHKKICELEVVTMFNCSSLTLFRAESEIKERNQNLEASADRMFRNLDQLSLLADPAISYELKSLQEKHKEYLKIVDNKGKEELCWDNSKIDLFFKKWIALYDNAESQELLRKVDAAISEQFDFTRGGNRLVGLIGIKLGPASLFYSDKLIKEIASTEVPIESNPEQIKEHAFFLGKTVETLGFAEHPSIYLRRQLLDRAIVNNQFEKAQYFYTRLVWSTQRTSLMLLHPEFESQ
jgi:uncharacterized protein YrzB (UPF0473 family)